MLPDAVKLLPEIDADRLRADLYAVEKHFSTHTNPTPEDSDEEDAGGWSYLPLRISGGDAEGSGRDEVADTQYMKHTPYVRELLDTIDLPLRAARFSSLAPGKSVLEHSDRPYGLSAGWVRLHIPVATNDHAILVLNGKDYCWQPGEFWYANFGTPHSLYNKGDEARVHLILDCYVSERLFELFPEHLRKEIEAADIMYFNEGQSLPDDLAGLSGAITLPSSFLRPYPEFPTVEEWNAFEKDDLEAELSVRDGHLVVKLGEHKTKLAHLGNGAFRPLCWTEEQTFAIESHAGARRIVFRYRIGSQVVETTREQPHLVG